MEETPPSPLVPTRVTHFQTPSPAAAVVYKNGTTPTTTTNKFTQMYSLATHCPTTAGTSRLWEDSSPWSGYRSARPFHPQVDSVGVTHQPSQQLLPPMVSTVPTPLAARSLPRSLFLTPRARSPLAPKDAQPATYTESGAIFRHDPSPVVEASRGLSPLTALAAAGTLSNVQPPLPRPRSSTGGAFSAYSAGAANSEILRITNAVVGQHKAVDVGSNPTDWKAALLSDFLTLPGGRSSRPSLRSSFLLERPDIVIVPAGATRVIRCPFRSLRVAIDEIQWSPNETGVVYALEMSHGCESGSVTLRPNAQQQENVCNAQMVLTPESNLRFEVRDLTGRSVGQCDVDIAKMIFENTSALTGHIPIGFSLDSPRLRVRSSIELSLLQAPENSPPESRAASTVPVSDSEDTVRDVYTNLNITKCCASGTSAEILNKGTVYIDQREVGEILDFTSENFRVMDIPCTETSKLLTLELFSLTEHVGNAVVQLQKTLHTKLACNEILRVFSTAGDELPLTINFQAELNRRGFDFVTEVLEEGTDEDDEEDQPTTLEGEPETPAASREEEEDSQQEEAVPTARTETHPQEEQEQEQEAPEEEEEPEEEEPEEEPEEEGRMRRFYSELPPASPSIELDVHVRKQVGAVLEEVTAYPIKCRMRRVLSEVPSARARQNLAKVRSEIVKVPAKKAMRSVLNEIPMARSKKTMRSVLSDIPMARSKREMKTVLQDIPVARTKKDMKTVLQEIPTARSKKEMRTVLQAIPKAQTMKNLKVVHEQILSAPFRKTMSSVCEQIREATHNRLLSFNEQVVCHTILNDANYAAGFGRSRTLPARSPFEPLVSDEDDDEDEEDEDEDCDSFECTDTVSVDTDRSVSEDRTASDLHVEPVPRPTTVTEGEEEEEERAPETTPREDLMEDEEPVDIVVEALSPVNVTDSPKVVNNAEPFVVVNNIETFVVLKDVEPFVVVEDVSASTKDVKDVDVSTVVKDVMATKDVTATTVVEKASASTVVVQDTSVPTMVKDMTATTVVEKASASTMKDVTATTVIKDVDASTMVKDVTATTVIKDVDASKMVKVVTPTTVIKDVDASKMVKDVTATTVIKDVAATTVVEKASASTMVKDVTASRIVKNEIASTAVHEASVSTVVKKARTSTIVKNEIASTAGKKASASVVKKKASASSTIVKNEIASTVVQDVIESKSAVIKDQVASTEITSTVVQDVAPFVVVSNVEPFVVVSNVEEASAVVDDPASSVKPSSVEAPAVVDLLPRDVEASTVVDLPNNVEASVAGVDVVSTTEARCVVTSSSSSTNMQSSSSAFASSSKTVTTGIDEITESLLSSLRASAQAPAPSAEESSGSGSPYYSPVDQTPGGSSSNDLTNSLKQIITNVQAQINTRNVSSTTVETSAVLDTETSAVVEVDGSPVSETRKAHKRRRTRKRKAHSTSPKSAGGEWVIQVTDEHDHKLGA